MAKTLFQWPGGKSGQFKRISKMMPEHTCFVEGFGGSGAVTFNKEPSDVTIYNDLDSDLTHFFTVYREAPERLCDWLEKVPYSYDTYETFAKEFYGWDNPDKDYEPPCEPLEGDLLLPEEITHEHIQRAGVFFTLRYMQFGAKYNGKSGFGRSKVQDQAGTFKRAKERLREFTGVWDNVTIENVSYEDLITKYDSEETLFYFDPPYIGTEQYYRESDFGHDEFCDHLEEIEGYWIVSYDEIPERLEKYHVDVEESTNFIDSGRKGEGKDTIETLVTNFDPSKVKKFTGRGQSGLGSFDQPKGLSNGVGNDIKEEENISNNDTIGTEKTSEDGSDSFLDFALEDEEDDEDTSSGFLDDAI